MSFLPYKRDFRGQSCCDLLSVLYVFTGSVTQSKTEFPIFRNNCILSVFFFFFCLCARVLCIFSCDPLQPPFSSVGMTNNAVEGGTMRGPQRALSPQHRCILAQGSPVVSGGGSGDKGKGD